VRHDLFDELAAFLEGLLVIDQDLADVSGEVVAQRPLPVLGDEARQPRDAAQRQALPVAGIFGDRVDPVVGLFAAFAFSLVPVTTVTVLFSEMRFPAPGIWAGASWNACKAFTPRRGPI